MTTTLRLGTPGMPGGPAVTSTSVTVTVDGHEVEVPVGSTILEAAEKAGRRIPTLCHHPDLPTSASAASAWWR